MLRRILLASTLAVMPVAVMASDLPSKKSPPTVPSQKSFLTGAFEIGGIGLSYDQNQNDVSDSIIGGYGSSFANATISEGVSWGINLQGDFLALNDSEDDFDDQTPTHAAAVGTNLVVHQGQADFGIFGAIGNTNEADDEFVLGTQLGVLAGYDIDTQTSLFAQIGYADIRVDVEEEGFTGWFVTGGVAHSISDDIALVVSGAYGSSDSYEDTNEEGYFWNVGGKAIVRVSDRNPIYLTAAYGHNYFETVGDSDIGSDHVVKLGLSIPFGENVSAKSTFNPYGASLLPFRAAAYAEVLD